MIDVSSVHTITVGDEITIIGSDGASVITADELATLADTISYEILCAIGRRIPRVYLRNGGATSVLRLC
jgi:alanine racemase